MDAEGMECVVGEAAKVVATDSKSAERWFERLFLAHYHRVLGTLIRLIGDSSRAEDLTGEVFWRAFRRGVASNHENFGAWLYRAATNLGIQYLRAASRRQRYEQSAGDVIQAARESKTPLDGIIQRESEEQVRATLTTLKRWQAQILILRQSGLSYAELADALRVQKGSVGTMLARAEAEFHRKYRQLHGKED